MLSSIAFSATLRKMPMSGVISKRKNKSQRLTWIDIGAVTGDTASVSASLLQSNTVLMGCAPSAYTSKELGEQYPPILRTISENGLTTDYVAKHLADVESW
jgi:hypothetical protein